MYIKLIEMKHKVIIQEVKTKAIHLVIKQVVILQK